MAADMEASMFIMFSMHVGVWCMCVHSACDTLHTPTPTLTPIHPPATPQGGLPESVKIQ